VVGAVRRLTDCKGLLDDVACGGQLAKLTQYRTEIAETLGNAGMVGT
jgi:hypothetical protein